MKRGLGLVAAGVAVALLLAGCGDKVAGTASVAPGAGAAVTSGSSSAPSPSGSGSSSSAEAWADQLCGSFLPLASIGQTPPDMSSASDPASAKKAISDYLTKAVNAFQTAVDGLNNLPSAPNAAAETAKTALVTALTPALQTMKDANDKLSAAGNDPQSMLDAVKSMEGLGTSMQSISSPLNSLTSSPEMEAAYKAAPNCQKLPA
jgi:hypothetical protein